MGNITSSANYGNSPLCDIVLILTLLTLLARNAVVREQDYCICHIKLQVWMGVQQDYL